MPDQKITDLGDGGLPQPTDDFVVARAGTNNKLAWSSLAAEATVGNVAVTLDGNTAGALALVSSGTLTLAGGNNITLSQAGNAVTISGPAAAGAQTAISGLANSQTTYTSGTVELVGTGAITVASNAGQQFVFSVNPQSVQPETQTFVAGISASDTLYTSGNVRFTGVGGGVTVSSNTGQRVDISVAAQSVQPETQTFVGGIGNSQTTYTSGTVNLSVVAGNLTIRSTTGQAFQFSMSQTVQPETQTAISGIANSQTTYTSGTVSLSELGAITIRSTTGNQFQFSVNSQTAQTGISGIANSQTTYTSGTVSLSELGAITIRSTTGNQFQLSVNAQSVQPETQTFIGGIGNSQTTYTSGTVNLSVVAGQLTIRSTTGNAFQFSASQSVQAETQTAISGIANSQTTYTSGTVSLSELGAITIRSTTGNQYQFSVNSQTVQTQGILSAGVSTGGNTVGNTTVNTGSRFVIVASGNATASQATAAGASTVTISVGTQTVQTQGILSAGVSTGGNTLGDTTVNTGSRLVIVGSNGITASQGTAAGATTITLSGVTTAAQTVQTQGILSAGVSTGGNTAGNTTVNTGSRLVFVGTNMVSLSQTTGAGATTISINATQSAQTQSNIQALYDGANSISTGTIRVTDANGVTFSVNGQTLSASVNQSISMFAVSNTTQSSSGTAHKSALSFGGAGIASVGVTGGSVVISVPSGGGAGDGGVFAGVSTMGNTAGSTGTVSTGNFVLVGTGPISLSQSTGAAGSAATISINAPATSSLSATGIVSISTNGSTISIGAPGLSVGVSTGGNTSGDTTVDTGSRMVLVGGNNITLSQATAAGASTITISNRPVTFYEWQNMPYPLGAVVLTHASDISKVPFYFPASIPGDITANTLAFKISNVTASQPNSFSVHLGVYTFANSTSANLLGSLSQEYVISSASSVSFSGVRMYAITGIGTHATLSSFSEGEYLFGMMVSATATNAMNFSLIGAGVGGGPLGAILPGTNQLSTGTSQGIIRMIGRGSTTVNAMPANVVASELKNQGAGVNMHLWPWIYIRS